jgi:hypothetical protein
MALQLVGLLHLCVEHPLNNGAPIGRCILSAKDLFFTIIIFFLFFIFNVRGADVAILCSNVYPLTGAVLLHVAKPMATVALDARGAPH